MIVERMMGFGSTRFHPRLMDVILRTVQPVDRLTSSFASSSLRLFARIVLIARGARVCMYWQTDDMYWQTD
jgi:hypothetical protein